MTIIQTVRDIENCLESKVIGLHDYFPKGSFILLVIPNVKYSWDIEKIGPLPRRK